MQLFIAAVLFLFLVKCDMWMAQYLQTSEEARVEPEEADEEEDLRVAIAASIQTASEEAYVRSLSLQ